MQGSDGFKRFAGGGFELLGIVADDVQLHVMEVADSIYRPHIEALLAADLEEVAPEPRIDLSRPPQ
jgi:hypothetical protein